MREVEVLADFGRGNFAGILAPLIGRRDSLGKSKVWRELWRGGIGGGRNESFCGWASDSLGSLDTASVARRKLAPRGGVFGRWNRS